MQLPLQHCWFALVKPQLFLESLLDLKPVLLVALEGLLWYLVFLKPLYFNGVSRYMVTTKTVSRLCLSSKQDLCRPPGKLSFSLLSRETTPICYHSRKLFQVVARRFLVTSVFLNGLFNGSSHITKKTSHTQEMHNTQSNRQGF